MKNLTFLLLLFAALFSAQQTLLQNPINENSLSNDQKLTSLMAKNYHATSYYTQNITNLEQNFIIKLPDGKIITANFIKKYQYSNQSSSATYKIVDDPEAELVFSEYNKVITGMYLSGEGEKYIFAQTAPAILAVSLVNEQLLIDQDDKNDTIVEPLNIIGAKNTLSNPNVCNTTTLCGSTTIDVMVVYTTAAKNAYGSVSQTNSNITTAITNFNVALVNSGVSNVTINLVYSGEIVYTESGDLGVDLPRLRNPTDGFMDDVQNLRSLYGADLVSLITATPTNTCGLGYVNTNPTDYNSESAYTVTVSSCVVSNYSLSHEMGHNMGLRHNWYVDSNGTPCEHQKGYVNRVAITNGSSGLNSKKWRTIMAYNNECSDNGFSCTRRNFWSNPTINFNSDPTGIAIGQFEPSNEAYGFARFACVVSEFASPLSLSTKEDFIENFSIYPNPVKDILYIKVPKNEDYNFNVITATGRNIVKTKNKNISVKGYETGVYYLVIYDKQNQLVGTKKFIIE